MTVIPTPDNRLSLQALRALIQQRTTLAALEVFHAGLGDVFEIPLPGFNPVMLVGPEANRFLLVEGRENLHWRAEQDPITRLLRHGVLVEDGVSHDSLRRLMNPALHRNMLSDYITTMWQCTDMVTGQWRIAADPPDMLIEMRRAALLILMQTLFSIDFRAQIEHLWSAILRTLRYISPGLWILWRDIPRPGYQRAIRQLDEYLQQIITIRRTAAAPDNDMLSMLIAADLPDSLIRDQLVTMIIAGHDTGTALLSWALYLLSTNPDVQVRARNEIDTVLGSDPPGITHISELRYLDQVINETLRLYPPIHLGSRIAASDFEFRGYRIPAGRRVLYSIYLTHRDARYWSNPAEFDPERFAPEQTRQRTPYTFLPFGGGPRNCIGTAFAQVEAKVVLARILQKFELTFTGHAVRPRMGATLEPHPGVRIVAKARA
jgi:cytochrome P450